MATATRTKENGYDYPLFKTPLRTPIRTPLRNGMLSSATLNDLASYSGPNKHLKFVGATSMNDLQTDSTTPIRLGKNKFVTPGSMQRRRALGLVNHNSHHLPLASSSVSNDDLSTLAAFKETINKFQQHDEAVVLPAPAPRATCSSTFSHPHDDLPHESNGQYQADTFDDLIPADERVERMLAHRPGGINLFAYVGGIENSIRCQSPVCTRINMATLLDMTDVFN